jgi:hypothetical protein
MYIVNHCSIFGCSACVNTLGKFNIPYLALPFNLIAVITFLTIKPQDQPQDLQDLQDVDFEMDLNDNSTINSTIRINWCHVGQGVMVSMGQVYAINDIVASSLMNLAVFLASPLLFFMSTIGAAVGTLAGNYIT